MSGGLAVGASTSLDFGANRLKNIATPTTTTDAATKAYVDTTVAASAGPIAGDGSDGDVTISSNTTLTMDMYYNSLTIDSGVTLTTNGYAVFVKNDLTWNGTIAAGNGTNASGATGGINTRGSLPTLDGGDGCSTDPCSNAFKFVNGNPTTSNNGRPVLTGTSGTSGKNGGAGYGTGNGASGGAVYLATLKDPYSAIEIARSVGIFAHGGSAGGGTKSGNAGGGSGAAGKTLLVVVGGTLTFGGSSAVTGTGGNGANAVGSIPDLSGAGSGGPGSLVLLVYNAKSGSLTTTTLTGGTKGSSANPSDGSANGADGYVVEVLF